MEKPRFYEDPDLGELESDATSPSVEELASVGLAPVPVTDRVPEGCTCGEFAGSSVSYADCPVHNPENQKQKFMLQITYHDGMIARFAFEEDELLSNFTIRLESNRTEQNVESWSIAPLY